MKSVCFSCIHHLVKYGKLLCRKQPIFKKISIECQFMKEKNTLKRIREAKEVDMEVVYMMGYDVWGENISSQDYIAMCNESSKYKRGIWYALEESNTKNLLCSLIVYKLNPSENMIVRGIGSIATPKPLRNRGYASFLIKEVINQLERNDQCDLIFFV